MIDLTQINMTRSNDWVNIWRMKDRDLLGRWTITPAPPHVKIFVEALGTANFNEYQVSGWIEEDGTKPPWMLRITREGPETFSAGDESMIVMRQFVVKLYAHLNVRVTGCPTPRTRLIDLE